MIEADDMPEIIINEQKILNYLKNLNINKSPGSDKVHPRVVK